jgi:isopentenyl-diphosphate delta-isomerase
MYYRIAVLWLMDEKGELLLARRSDTKAHDPGLWGPSVTGKVEKGEAIEEAVARETEEELGIPATSYQATPLFEEEFVHPDGAIRKFSIYYAVMPRQLIADQLSIDAEEVAETKWLSTQEIRELLTTPPGKVLPASAFVLWKRVLEMLEAQTRSTH